jgi:predicted GIY-YIG superfamily endonuclease
MNAQFDEITRKFPDNMKKLLKNPPVSPYELKENILRGIYVFYENGTAIYVGRSRNITQRIREHQQQSSDSEVFAFLIAKRDAEKAGMTLQYKNGKNMTRNELQKYPPFKQIFSDAKKRVAMMKVQVIGIDDPVEQTLFEVYAALELKTKYNTWDTH